MIDMDNKHFMGVNNFIWWFGVVENRNDPLNAGRCQVRCFGFHNEDVNQIPIEDLPWAQPVLPIGAAIVKPPAEGTMVFGFFADGLEGRFPVILGTVPGIPDEIRQANAGFTDPYTDAEKAAALFPRKVLSSKIKANAAGPEVVDDVPKRNPANLNEPSISRLARPDRVEDPATGATLGSRSPSIANTSIDYQRKNRLVGIKSSDGYSWKESFPSFNPKYPFNNVTETESGHAFELDDTPEYERVQLSHRTGSTLEFLPSGSVKLKAFNNKQDITMGDSREYTAGNKHETTQGNMFIRINGKLIIECDGYDLVSSGDINIKGKNVKITSGNALDVYAGGEAKILGASKLDLRSEARLAVYGGGGTDISSGCLTSISGTPNPVAAAVAAAIKEVTGSEPDIPIATILNSGVKILGPNFWISTALTSMNSIVTNILPPTSFDPKAGDSANPAAKWRRRVPKLVKTQSPNSYEPTDGMGFLEQERVKTLNKELDDAELVAEEVNKDLLQNTQVVVDDPTTNLNLTFPS
jgi:hypothetical protein